MTVVELARLLLEQAPHHYLAADCDGWACEIFAVRSEGGGNVALDVEPPADHAIVPLEPSRAMLKACNALGLDDAALAVLWSTMLHAYEQENE